METSISESSENDESSSSSSSTTVISFVEEESLSVRGLDNMSNHNDEDDREKNGNTNIYKDHEDEDLTAGVASSSGSDRSRDSNVYTSKRSSSGGSSNRDEELSLDDNGIMGFTNNKWSLEENELLLHVVKTLVEEGNVPLKSIYWEEVSGYYLVHKTAEECRQRYTILSKQQLKLQKKAVKLVRGIKTDELSNKTFKGEDSAAARKTVPWSKEEIKLLFEKVASFKRGTRVPLSCWVKLAEYFPGRSATACRSNYYYLAKKGTNRRNVWTEEEEALLIYFNKLFPRKWTKIVSKRLPGHTPQQARIHWNSVIEKKLQQEGGENYEKAAIEKAITLLDKLERNHCLLSAPVESLGYKKDHGFWLFSSLYSKQQEGMPTGRHGLRRIVEAWEKLTPLQQIDFCKEAEKENEMGIIVRDVDRFDTILRNNGGSGDKMEKKVPKQTSTKKSFNKPWSRNEDFIILQGMHKRRVNTWAHIVKQLPGRSTTNVKYRYKGYLDPALSLGWNDNAESLLIYYHQQVGNMAKWSNIAAQIKKILSLSFSPTRVKRHFEIFIYNKFVVFGQNKVINAAINQAKMILDKSLSIEILGKNTVDGPYTKLMRGHVASKTLPSSACTMHNATAPEKESHNQSISKDKDASSRESTFNDILQRDCKRLEVDVGDDVIAHDMGFGPPEKEELENNLKEEVSSFSADGADDELVYDDFPTVEVKVGDRSICKGNHNELPASDEDNSGNETDDTAHLLAAVWKKEKYQTTKRLKRKSEIVMNKKRSRS